MLVLTRKNEEAIVLYIGGERVVIRLLKSTQGRAQVGIDASQDVKIIREELDQHGSSIDRSIK